MLNALIMAGGVGSRFWPKSTPETPKQFLKLLNDKTMLQITYDRMSRFIPKDNIFIATNNEYINKIKEQVPGIRDVNIITEPCSKNTGPCILLSTIYIDNIYKDSNIVCVPSDHFIKNEDEFIDIIKTADEFVAKNKKAIVTIGIKPTRAEIGYGYIKFAKGNDRVIEVSKFVEKPDAETAKEYVKSKEYLWNAGMYIFDAENMLKEFKKNTPNEYDLLINLPKYDDKNYYKILKENYEKCTKISIDYAVMEKAKNMYTIPADLDWDDIGTWNSLERYLPKDGEYNIVKGDAKIINSKNNIVYGNNKKIVLIDIDDIFCIDSNNVTIIGKKDSISKVHNLKDEI